MKNTKSGFIRYKNIVGLFTFFTIYLCCIQIGRTQESEFKPSGLIWGYMFGDVFYKAGGDTLFFGKSEYAASENHTLGGRLRRCYFGYDYNISPRWSTSFLLESSAATTTGGGFFGVVVKLGYLEYKNAIPQIPNSLLKLGLIPTPVFAFPEKSWGYRSVEKEALELRGLGSNVDQGVSLQGNFDVEATSGFVLMIGNGSGNKPIAGKYLEYYLSIHKKFFHKKLNVEAMFDYKKLDKELNRTLLRGFVSYESPKFRIGLEISPNIIDEKVLLGNEKVEIHTHTSITHVDLYFT